jgi:biotin carboxyl carrier protein
MRENAAMVVSRQELTSLMEMFEDLGLSELILNVGGTRVELTSSGKPPLGRSTMTTSGPPLHHVLAPSVGIVRPAPLTTPGERVRADDVVCVLDVWTSAIPVQAGLDGIVRKVHVAEGTMVEYGQLLFDIEHV